MYSKLTHILAPIWLALILVGDGAASPWDTLQAGVEYATFEPATLGFLHVVRVDPSRAEVECVSASSRDKARRTAGSWCRDAGLAVAINLGMFALDGLSNVGYHRCGDHRNNEAWNQYRSVLCLYPSRADLPTVQLLDLARDARAPDFVSDYAIVVQNLRLIRYPGKNVWAESQRKWSEAAVAVDGHGRLLFLFSRAPHTMAKFNGAILSMPLGIQRAMHVEGGPEASLSIHSGGLDLDLCGSYETGFLEDDSNGTQWPIPNVLGVRRR